MATANTTASGQRETSVLCVRDLSVMYSGVIRGITGVDLDVSMGSTVVLVGVNGSGKTTLLRAIAGLLSHHRAAITTGSIELFGDRIDHLAAPEIVRRGVAQVMEARRIFADLTVDENLRLGGFTCRRPKSQSAETKAGVFALFPTLAERREALAGYLSGGEQQMLAIGRALMARPRLLLLDEPSLGLAPIIVSNIETAIREINKAGTTVLLVEQNAGMALALADHAYILENGSVVEHGEAGELRSLREAYLGRRSESLVRAAPRGPQHL